MNRPIVWSIAGSDSGAGAGLQADLRAIDSFDVHACTAVAAITAQNSVRVERVSAVETELLDAQLAALASDLRPRAIKLGLLGSVDNVACVARWVDRLRASGPVALVVDPVWRASTGADLSGPALRDCIAHELLPRATAITPNRAEAAWLLGWDAQDMTDPAVVECAAAALRELGPEAVVITGGDAGGSDASDLVDTPQARGWLRAQRVDTRHHHGSGCVFAASMAAAFALDFCAADAAVLAKMSAAHSLHDAYGAGLGAGAVRPGRGFGLQRGVLPTMDSRPQRRIAGFPALDDSALGLYPIVDSAQWVERMLAAGVRTLQLRVKGGPHETLSQEIRRSVQAARAAGAQLFINDHWALAMQHDAYGVHLGQDDLSAADLGALQRAGLRLGISTHTLWEVCRARAWKPSYIACGPVHETRTKDMPWRPQGIGNLAYWCSLLEEPVVAIGGMDHTRTIEAIRCGAAGVAVLRGIVQADDPERETRRLIEAVHAARLQTRLPSPSLPRSTLVP
jgi:hydroxymethylpyrimidine kinase/phosphomethylpyrimidine kinase/thiamine-phosphate diphosphorylase